MYPNVGGSDRFDLRTLFVGGHTLSVVEDQGTSEFSVRSLDQDALYHVGRIHETAGNIEETEAVITELRATAPEDLLATLLEHDIAVRRGDEAAVEQAAARFLAAYDAEIAGNAQEYIDHRSSLEKLRAEAQAKLTTPN
jgi:hypothetical protein